MVEEMGVLLRRDEVALRAVHVLDHHRGLERPRRERANSGLMQSPSVAAEHRLQVQLRPRL